MMNHARFVALLLAFVLSGVAAAQTDAAKRSKREYDLRDLMVNVPNLNPRLIRELYGPHRRLTLPRDFDKILVDWLHSLTKPGEAAIEVGVKEGMFAVTATEAQHARIEESRAQLATRMRRQITCEVRTLWLPRDAAAALDAELAEKLSRVRLFPMIAAGGERLTGEQTSQLVEATQKHADASQLIAPRVTLFDGQRAYVITGADRQLLTDYEKDAAGAWQPKSTNVMSGVVLDLQCRTGVGGSIAMHAKFTQTRLLDVVEKPFEADPAAGLNVYVPILDVRKLDSLLATQSGETLLVAPVQEQGPRDENGADVFILIKATVIEQR